MYSQARGTNGGPGKRNERFEQMTKQQELIEKKKREIQAKLEAEKLKKEEEAKRSTEGASKVVGRGVPSSSTTSSNKDSESDDIKPAAPDLKFANDGSFMEQFRRMQEEQKKKEENKEIKKELFDEENEYGSKQTKPLIKYLNPPVKSSYNEEASNSNPSVKLETFTNTSSPSMDYENRAYKQSRPDSNERYADYSRPSFRGCFQNAPPPPPPPPPPPHSGRAVPGGFPSQVVRRLAQQVAEQGDHLEERARRESSKDPLFWFLNRPDSNEYRRYREVVAEYAHELRQASAVVIKSEYGSPQPVTPILAKRRTSYSSSDEGSDDEKRARRRKRKSRWGDDGSGGATQCKQEPSDYDSLPAPVPPPQLFGALQLRAPMLGTSLSQISPVPPPIVGASTANFGDVKPLTTFGNFPLMLNMDPSSAKPGSNQASLSKVTRTNPQLLAYAQQAYGTTQLDEDQWKQCEEAYKMNMVFQDIARKKARDQQLEVAGKFKHEYDSDEETDGGTWEHKQRMKEMEKTRDWADEITSKAKGKHHIGDFLPPEELSKFMDKYKAVKEGKQLDDSDYQEFKITESNLGFKMLQKMGWTEGQGLGSSGQGITAPIQKGNVGTDKQGLGQEMPGDLTGEDDEFSAYRKRMMLAYRFRPNPLNNPRRAYY